MGRPGVTGRKFRALGQCVIVGRISFSGMLFESDGAHRKPVDARRKLNRRCGFDSSKEPTHRQGYRCLLGIKRVTRDVGNVN